MNGSRIFFKSLLTCILLVPFGSVGSRVQAQFSPSTIEISSSQPFDLSKEAKDAGIDGIVQLHLKVDERGIITHSSVVAGPMWPCETNPEGEIEEVKRRVLRNMIYTRFEPYMSNGKATPVEILMPYALSGTYFGQKFEETSEYYDKEIVRMGLLNFIAKKIPKPDFPPRAKMNYRTGLVEVLVVVDETGKVIKAGAISGSREFHKTTRKSACKAEFPVKEINGKPVKVTGIIRYNFSK